MSEKRKKPNYTEEFKQNAVSLVLEHGYNCHEAARRLDTPASNVLLVFFLNGLLFSDYIEQVNKLPDYFDRRYFRLA